MTKLFLSCLLALILLSCNRTVDVSNNSNVVADGIKPIEDSVFFRKVKFNLPPAIDSVIHTYTSAKGIKPYDFLRLYVFKQESCDEYIVLESPNMIDLKNYPSLFYDIFDSTFIFLYTGTENLFKEKTYKVVIPVIIKSRLLESETVMNDSPVISYLYDNYTKKIIKKRYVNKLPMQIDTLESDKGGKIIHAPPNEGIGK